VFGGLADDNMKLVSNFEFLGQEVLERGAVALGFADPTLEVIAGANHGFGVIGEAFEVTRSEGNRVSELDGRPAWQSLMARLDVAPTTTPMEIAALAMVGEQLPPGLHEEYGSPFIVRGSPLKDDTGAIFLTGNCPVGTRLWLMRRDEQRMFDGVDRLVEQLLNRCRGRRPVAVFHADCGARGRMSFNRILKDEIIRRIQQPILQDHEVPWLGMYGGGELTMLGGRNRIHMFTTSLYLIVKKDDQAGETE
jgi:hypothetical protein